MLAAIAWALSIADAEAMIDKSKIAKVRLLSFNRIQY